PDGWARTLERGQRDADVLQVKVAALVGDRLARKQALDDLERLDVTAHALFRVHVPGLGLDVAVSETDARNEPTPPEHLQPGHLRGDVERLVERQEQDASADRHAVGLRGDPPEHRKRLEVGERMREVVLAGEDQIEADGARQPYLLDVIPEALDLRVARPMLDREAEPELDHGCENFCALPMDGQTYACTLAWIWRT